MKTILIIDDQQGILDILTEEINQAIVGVQCVSETDFDRAVEKLEECRPDAVVLDLLQGAGTTDPPGQRTWQRIWTGRFCPVVVYTAFDGMLDPPIPEDHPFVKLVRKGNGTEGQVIEHLRLFKPLVDSLAVLHREIDQVLQRVLRDTAGAALIGGDDPTHLVHAARRRVAAFMDEKTATEGRALFSWEQYLVPAFGDHPLTGDVLRVRDADWRAASQYRLILTPSCDLVAGRNENGVLVAKCSDPTSLKEKLQLPGNENRAADRIRSQVLTQGCWNGFLPLPEFPNRIPLLVASLKSLEVLAYESIGPPDGGTDYERIASIDSPFREQIAWSFMSTAARPGMPDRDLAPWAQAIATAQTTPEERDEQG
ncbi:MAG: response regulator [Phycisphaeraceae bacterium]|nr:MAG: response regulator [Phycisphaeraceae bacterium]